MLVCPECFNDGVVEQLNDQECEDCGGDYDDCPNSDCDSGFIVGGYQCDACGWVGDESEAVPYEEEQDENT
jgi:hypothetical protein